MATDAQEAPVAEPEHPTAEEDRRMNGPWTCRCGCGCRQKHLNATGSYCRDCEAGDCP